MSDSIIKTMNNRFTSGNSVPVERATIKADEWQELRQRIAELQNAAPRWHDGEPPKAYRGEWFIAETIHGDRVVLTELPEENSYDYTTKDDTYMKAWLIKRWMQFHDSEFIPPDSQSEDTENRLQEAIT